MFTNHLVSKYSLNLLPSGQALVMLLSVNLPTMLALCQHNELTIVP